MKISHRWLREFVPGLEKTPKALAELLTMAGLEVEGMQPHPGRGAHLDKAYLDQFLIGEVLRVAPCQNADRLQLLLVSVGTRDERSIVCGALNVAVGQRVVVALAGAQLLSLDGSRLRIRETVIRGNPSQGMLCSAYELGVGADRSGIIVLETDCPNGTPASAYYTEDSQDTVFEIAVTPDRGDALSHYGVARDISACLGQSVRLPEGLNQDLRDKEGGRKSPLPPFLLLRGGFLSAFPSKMRPLVFAMRVLVCGV